MKYIALIVLITLLSACGTSKTKLSDDGQDVRIMETRGHSGCEVVDKVVGINEKGSEELAKNHARNMAAKAGGNGIVINEVVHNGAAVQVFATAYQCP